MNHLAHFFLSGKDEDIIIGNFAADFITNKEKSLFTEGIQKGIELHRRIDSYTDTHPTVKESTKRLHPQHHKYAPVLVDIYYDFLLAKNWELYAEKSVSLRLFINDIYIILIKNQLRLPKKLIQKIDIMIEDDFLMQYTTYEGLEKTFLRIERYAKYDGNFKSATQSLKQNVDLFDIEFKQFFPDLVHNVRL
jgi:acyl carrier protein phosphodiesterase